MLLLTTSCAVLLLVCAVDSRRPRAASPQERRAKPGLQLPTAEDLVGALVPSRWKWPLYPEQRPPTLGEWRQGQKPGEWNWRGERRVLDNRWNPYFGKKPTGLEKKKKPFGPSYPQKFLGPKFQKQKRPVKVRLAPVADLRPKSIDRIDILRPQPQPQAAEVTRNFLPSLNSLKSLKSVQRGEKDKTSGRVVEEKPVVLKTTTETILKPKANISPGIEVDGFQIYMFRGDEGIGGYTYKPPAGVQQNLVLPDTDTRKKIQWSKAEIKQPKVQKVLTTQRPPRPTVSPYRQSPPVTRRDIAPPFPTRHTTTPPDQENQPIVIIAQSNVAQN